MSRHLLMVAGVACSAAAQVLLKRAGGAATAEARWFAWIAASALAYAAAFVLYAAILRRFPLSVAAPAMTVAVMCVVVGAGALLGEPITGRHLLGLALGVASILVVLG
jgi:drug/metabolite transporter (DMT)-like permease